MDHDAAQMAIERIVGGAAAGFRDGDDPLFSNPLGLVFHGETLFVADAGNHAIRAVTMGIAY